MKLLSKKNAIGIIECYNEDVRLSRYGFDECVRLLDLICVERNIDVIPSTMHGYCIVTFNKYLNEHQKSSISAITGSFCNGDSTVSRKELYKKHLTKDEDHFMRSIGLV